MVSLHVEAAKRDEEYLTRTVAELQAREENQLYVFLRACLFMKHAGYMERATACFQALMEM